jgi:hypothetical protein
MHKKRRRILPFVPSQDGARRQTKFSGHYFDVFKNKVQ